MSLLLLAVLLLPLNIEIAPGVRPSDIALLLFFAFALACGARLSLIWSMFALVLSAVLLNSIWINLLASPADIGIERVAFLYKYLLVILLPLAVYGIDPERDDCTRLTRVLYLVFVVLAGWVYAYLLLRAAGSIQGSFRPSYPFSTSFSQSDAHLYSAYLSIQLLFYVGFAGRELRHGIFHQALVVILAMGALALTGSRTGVVVLLAGVAMLAPLALIHYFSLRRLAVTFVITGLVVIAALFFASYLGELSDRVVAALTLLERLTNLDVAGDRSIASRITKLFIGVDDCGQWACGFGSGPLHASVTWYDGGVSILLAHGGAPLVALVSMGCVAVAFQAVSLAKRNRAENQGYVLVVVLLSYVLANVITEYALVSRSAIPSVLALVILMKSISFATLVERGMPVHIGRSRVGERSAAPGGA